MSYELSGEDVLLVQRLLSCEGLYNGELNGEWTGATDKAKQEFYLRSRDIKAEFGEFDERSEKCIETLLLKTQVEARKFMSQVKGSDKIVKIISGTRTFEEQRKLYNKGRWGNKNRVVTNARPGQSTHNFGIAWDIGIFSKSGQYSKSERDYSRVGKFSRSDNIQWGGDWKKPDLPHYQLAFPEGILKKEALAKFQRGEPLFI